MVQRDAWEALLGYLERKNEKVREAVLGEVGSAFRQVAVDDIVLAEKVMSGKTDLVEFESGLEQGPFCLQNWAFCKQLLSSQALPLTEVPPKKNTSSS